MHTRSPAGARETGAGAVFQNLTEAIGICNASMLLSRYIGTDVVNSLRMFPLRVDPIVNVVNVESSDSHAHVGSPNSTDGRITAYNIRVECVQVFANVITNHDPMLLWSGLYIAHGICKTVREEEGVGLHLWN